MKRKDFSIHPNVENREYQSGTTLPLLAKLLSGEAETLGWLV